MGVALQEIIRLNVIALLYLQSKKKRKGNQLMNPQILIWLAQQFQAMK